jgi:hypothetical protein
MRRRNVERPGVLVDAEAGPLVHAWEHPPTDDDIGERVGVPTRDEHAPADAVRAVPLHRYPVRRVLALQPEPAWQASGAHLTEAEQTDSGHREAVDELRTKRRRNQRCCSVRVEAVVDQHPPLDPPLQDRMPHQPPAFALGWRRRRITICSGHTADKNPPTQSARPSSINE